MNGVLDFYQQEAEQSRSKIPWLSSLQRDALEHLKARAFPTRQNEAWKYTALEAFLGKLYETATKPKLPFKGFNTTFPLKSTVVLHNGEASLVEAALPPSVLVLPMARALTEQASLIEPYLGKILLEEHGFQHLNTAMLNRGVFIYVPAGTRLEQPLVLTHVHDSDVAIYLRHLIIVGEGSNCTVVESYQGLEDCPYFTNTVTEILVGKDASCSHYKIQKEGHAAVHIGQLSVRQLANSHFESHSLSLGGKLVRSDTCIDLKEPLCNCLMNGIYVPTEGQHMDHHTKVHHQVPNCSSQQDYKGILMGQSRAVFNGQVLVEKNASGSNARQSNKNLLLSPKAEVDTLPQLEIFTDDVSCAHGATIGQLDVDALFYLAARGIGPLEATRYLIEAFAAENIAKIPHRGVSDWMSHLLTKQLEYEK